MAYASFRNPTFQTLRLSAVVLAAALASLGQVQAAETSVAAAASASHEVTRAEVLAELAKARAEGTMPGENEVDPFTTQRRAEVLAKAKAATRQAEAASAAASQVPTR
ncbi:DUF4148 domain-containing protein [Roseateles koreensis]|uniref:DUF4148 domain-containing protein n=1 Tax=Roseateles koreensis TaxID=2987526 RepID=A0ABT5KXW9_9BURK|nr:DUF4148 domain-containing protein [Roseateles koreensis]MDC8786592.1 DUF4148 domain-containing protein [Roseateles koreensis]